MIQEQGFFERLGEAIGSLIGGLIGAIRAVFGGFFDAIDEFVDGLARGIGLEDPSILAWGILILGLLCLYTAIRAFLRGGIVWGVIWTAIGLIVVGWVVT